MSTSICDVQGVNPSLHPHQFPVVVSACQAYFIFKLISTQGLYTFIDHLPCMSSYVLLLITQVLTQMSLSQGFPLCYCQRKYPSNPRTVLCTFTLIHVLASIFTIEKCYVLSLCYVVFVFIYYCSSLSLQRSSMGTKMAFSSGFRRVPGKQYFQQFYSYFMLYIICLYLYYIQFI